jgi:hypothetical protein
VLMDLGGMVAYALVLIAVFFMAGVVALFALLHWVARAWARRAARAAGTALTATATEPSPAPPQTAIPAQRLGAEWPTSTVRAAFSRTPRAAARRT